MRRTTTTTTAHARVRRGSVPVEYTALSSLIAAVLLGAFLLPGVLADAMAGAGHEMNAPGSQAVDDGVSWAPAAGEPADPTPWAAPPTTTPDDDDGWGSDPWSNRGCNQGLGNGGEGCDPGNSNHNQPSNDEEGGGRGQGKGPNK